jgi:hypothetical protein
MRNLLASFLVLGLAVLPGALRAQAAVTSSPSRALAERVRAYGSPEEAPGLVVASAPIVDTARVLLRSLTAWQPAGSRVLLPRGRYRRIYVIDLLAGGGSNAVVGTLRLGGEAIELEVGGRRFWHALVPDVEPRLLMLIGFARAEAERRGT